MKKLLLILISILLFIYALLTLLSFRGDYCVERKLWEINHQSLNISSHQESMTEYAISQSAQRYQLFANTYKGTIYAKRAQLMIGDLYALRKNYTKARQEYQKAVGPDKELSAQAEFDIAKTYELEGYCDKALVIDKNIIQEYPITVVGFSVPMYLTGHLVGSGDQKSYTDQAFADALAFYQNISPDRPSMVLMFRKLPLLTSLDV